MSEEVQWDEFDNMLVVKRLKDLIAKWWNVKLNFTDKKGFLQGVPEGRFFNPLNPVSQAIVSTKKGFEDCIKDARSNTASAMNLKEAKIMKTTSGFASLILPIFVDGNYVGCAYADGFISADKKAEHKAALTNYVERLLPEQAAELLGNFDKLPHLTDKDVEYLSELVTVVVDEIMNFNQTVTEQATTIKNLSSDLGARYSFDQMVGKSSAMQNLYGLLDRVCDSDATVLINGENGTGKELISKALHYNSKRKAKKFLVVNCGAFNENLLESELFGHMKGSFTGAVKDKKGLFESASGGTLFLDEIGDTSMTMQVKLLRVLQDGTFTPVGSTEIKKSNVRVLAATNKDLQRMVKEGTFREDLFYRLNVINVIVPALRDRKEDIPMLVDHFLGKFCKKNNWKLKKMDKKVLETMMNHDWPGNVRELENEVERLLVLSGEKGEFSTELLSPRIREKADNKFPGLRMQGKLKDAVDSLEKQLILEGLERTGWNKSKLAKELGISRAGLINKVNQYGLEKRRTS